MDEVFTLLYVRTPFTYPTRNANANIGAVGNGTDYHREPPRAVLQRP